MKLAQTATSFKSTPMSPRQHFRFSKKSYASYSQGACTVYEKTNIFHLISNNAVEALSLRVVVVQIFFMLLLKAVGETMPYRKW